MPVWDGTNTDLQDDEITFDHPYEPSKNVTKPKKTVTGTIKGIQETLLKGHEKLVDYEDVAAALAERNLLRLTKTIQISSNKKFLSIQFESKEVMETFCVEPLLIRGFNIAFRPEKKFSRKKRLLTISFKNIPRKP